MVASTWPAEERQMPSSVCRSCAILGQHTECHSHSSLTERVVPTKAFLMNTQFQTVENILPALEPGIPHHSNLKNWDETQKGLPGSGKRRMLWIK